MKNISKPAIIVSFALTIAIAIGCKKDNSHGGGNTGGTAPTQPVTPFKSDVAMWLTQGDRSSLLQKLNLSLVFNTGDNQLPTIDVDTTQTYQTIDGFGFCLTGGSASVINALPATQKDDLLKELFLTDTTHIGISYLRISIGASDLSAYDFTYDELPPGTLEDLNMQSFTLDEERKDLLPILKKIVALNPSIKILACPWTAPTWMKSNKTWKGGSLLPAYYDAYAKYFVKYIQAMKAEGITIDAITPQNEPLNPNNNPSMSMQATEQAAFIKNSLGPQFKAAGLNTKIIVWDHNADNPQYPIGVLSDNGAYPYVDGSAFHLYSGSISALSSVHQAFPEKNVYFTEQWVNGQGENFAGDLQWHTNNLIIGATRNWSRNVLEWNLASDPNWGPHTTGGCSTCQGAITVGSNTVTRNVSYYIIGQASKFVRPGSVRIASSTTDALPNVAFKTQDGKKVLIVLNNTTSSQTFNIKFNGKTVTPTLGSQSVATFIW